MCLIKNKAIIKRGTDYSSYDTYIKNQQNGQHKSNHANNNINVNGLSDLIEGNIMRELKIQDETMYSL